MIKYVKFTLVFVVLVHLIAGCSEAPSRRRTGKGRPPEVAMPDKNTKIVVVIPGGAGAMRVSLGVLEAIQGEVGPIDATIDMVGGISSGALLAAAVASGVSLSQLKTDLPTMLRTVFPEINNLGDKLVAEGFKLDELEAIYKEMGNDSKTTLDFAPAAREASFSAMFSNAVKNSKKPAMASKMTKFITGAGGLRPDIAAIIAAFDPAIVSANLGVEIDRILGAGATVNSAKFAKLIAFASDNKKPVFIVNTSLAKFLPGSYAVGTTPLSVGLLASSAIPKVITPPAVVLLPGPTPATPLTDGFIAAGSNDPSAILYEVFSKQFAGENLMIVFVGNGGAVDSAFRKSKFAMKSGVAEIEANGKKIFFAAIDSKIIDSKGEDLFNVSGFYDNKDLYSHMDKAVTKATEHLAYKWVIKAIKAVKP